ncbi:MAG: hypothetical protein QGH20_01085 [Candidatus Latescibacteria bacterium]|jgi:hypothetical protein|nr:hypothetical protein [Candidatus Latescibacterota bacterium]
MQLKEIFPSIPKVERLVTVTPNETDEDTSDFWVWFRSLQGLANRVEPHLCVMRPHPLEFRGQQRLHHESHWLDYY